MGVIILHWIIYGQFGCGPLRTVYLQAPNLETNPMDNLKKAILRLAVIQTLGNWCRSVCVQWLDITITFTWVYPNSRNIWMLSIRKSGGEDCAYDILKRNAGYTLFST